MQLSTSNSRRAAFVIVLALLIGIGSASYEWARRYSERQNWVTHTYQVMAELNALSASLNSASAARRGYVMSGDKSMIANLDEYAKSTAEHLANLRALSVDNPRQQQRLSQLGPLLDDRTAQRASVNRHWRTETPVRPRSKRN